MEKVQFDQATGKRLSKPFVQKFNIREFQGFVKRTLELQGWTLEILHDPTAKK